MGRLGWTISRHLLVSVLPYFVFSWILLSVILFFQQASRYSDIFFNASIPSSLVFELTVALVPNVIAFTCPMAALVGIVLGLSRLQSDSELVAIRAAGIGNVPLIAPLLVIGFGLSLFALFVNTTGVPVAAAIAKRVGIQGALYKLENPIEPGEFNTGVGGLTIYVRDRSREDGSWKQMFLFGDEPQNRQTRIITAESGRIDTRGTNSELVLSDAIVMNLPYLESEGVKERFASESINELRIQISTGRAELLKRMESADQEPEALGLIELLALTRASSGIVRTEGEILFARRVLLSITPLLFSLLGAALVLRFTRGGRGFGLVLALGGLISYYMLVLLSEQVARTAGISPIAMAGMPILSCLIASLLFLKKSRTTSSTGHRSEWRIPKLKLPKLGRGKLNPLATKGRLLDWELSLTILRFWLLTAAFLAAIYIIFTAFDMWRFAAATSGGALMLVKYLLYLLPLVFTQLLPSALMIAAVAAFVIKSRQNEIVTWIGSGMSVYRVLSPCFALVLGLGLMNFLLQETVLPETNQRQDALRATLRSKGLPHNAGDRSWSATGNRIYSFDTPELGGRVEADVSGIYAYEFGIDGRINAVYRATSGLWDGTRVKISGSAERLTFRDGLINREVVNESTIAEAEHPFSYANQKPSHLNSFETWQHAAASESENEKRNLSVALNRKLATPFIPLILVLFSVPFAISIGRRKNIFVVSYAVGIWLVFTGATSFFEQSGQGGLLGPIAAIWSPIILFGALGLFLTSKIKT